jgi:hypothetical protein
MNNNAYGRVKYFLSIKLNFAQRDLISATGKIWKDGYIYTKVLSLLE